MTTPAKRQRLPDEPTGPPAASAGVGGVLDVEMLLHAVLRRLDAPSIANFVEVLAVNKQWRKSLKHEALWTQLLVERFGARRSNGVDELRVVVRGDLVRLAGMDGDDEGEDDDDEEDEDDEAQALAIVAAGTAALAVGAAAVAVASAAGTFDEQQQNLMNDAMARLEAAASRSLRGIRHGFRATMTDSFNTVSSEAHRIIDVARARSIANGNQSTTDETALLRPDASVMVLSAACDELKEFLLTAEEWKRFADNVVIVQGDIGVITELNGHAIDGIAFPTTSFLSNPGIGSAAVVHQRAGDQLATHVRDLRVQLNTGEVHVTPGFNAGVNKLIHVVGPSSYQRRCYDILQVTYMNILRAARRENLQCVAMTSVSTGNLGVPCQEGAQSALRAIKRFLNKEKWPGVVGIVCFEQQVFDAFTEEKKALVEAFNVAGG